MCSELPIANPWWIFAQIAPHLRLEARRTTNAALEDVQVQKHDRMQPRANAIEKWAFYSLKITCPEIAFLPSSGRQST